MKDYEKDILKCLNESCEANEASDQFTGLRETLADVEKQFGVVLDTDIDDNGEGEFWFDTNYNRNTFETESEANEFENKFQEEFEKWCRVNGYECSRSEDEDAPLSFWIRKKSVNENSDSKKLDWQKIQPILDKLFDGEIAFDCIHDEDGTLEFKAESWLELPSEFQIEDEIEDKFDVKTSVEYNKYNEAGVIDDEGEIISIFITPKNSEKINEAITMVIEFHVDGAKEKCDEEPYLKRELNWTSENTAEYVDDYVLEIINRTLKFKQGTDYEIKDPMIDVDYWDMFISKDGENYAGQIARFYELNRAKRACKYYNKHSKGFCGKYVLVDKEGKIIFDKDGDRK